MNKNTIKNGLIFAGIANILGVLIFSKLFTNDFLSELNPTVMSKFGLLMIIVWGLAYLSVAKTFQNAMWLIAVFAVEKLIYGVIWIDWFFKADIKAIFEKDTLTGIYYSIYGIYDLIFMVFFIIAFFSILDLDGRARRKKELQ